MPSKSSWRDSLTVSERRISPGVKRASSPGRSRSAHLAARKSPLESVSHTKAPCALRPLPGTQAASGESCLSFKSAPSVSVPGVTIRTILRSMLRPGAASVICSQTATDTPAFTRRARYCSSVAAGTPAIGISLPLESLPRRVSVRPRMRLARMASSKKVS